MNPLKTPSSLSAGRALADVLAGSWRQEPLFLSPETIGASQLEALLPLLAGSGAGALAWRRLRHSALAQHPVALMLQKRHFKQALDAKLQERDLLYVFQTLQAVEVRPLLAKGWATARLYPETGLRAVGDIDLLIDPAGKAATEKALGITVIENSLGGQWDIKTQVPAIYQISNAALFAHQEHVKLGETEIAVLGAEDQLRILCLHFLKHGGWRPLWLCDVAVALESRPQNFNWERCLGHDKRCAQRILCTLGLAHQILGASLEGTPVAERSIRPPVWMVSAILKRWGAPPTGLVFRREPFLDSLRTQPNFWQAMRKRWPDSVQATMFWQISLDLPPWIAQSAVFIASGLDFLWRAPRMLQQRKSHSTPLPDRQNHSLLEDETGD